MSVQVLHGCDASVTRVSIVEVVQPLALLPVPETTAQHTDTLHLFPFKTITYESVNVCVFSDQMLSLSATAMQVLKGWNFTTDGTPGFRLMNIWSSRRETPVMGWRRAKKEKDFMKLVNHRSDSCWSVPHCHHERVNPFYLFEVGMYWACNCTYCFQEIATVLQHKKLSPTYLLSTLTLLTLLGLEYIVSFLKKRPQCCL